MRIAAVSIVLLAMILVSSTWFVSQPVFDEHMTDAASANLKIAPLTQALTFARTNGDSRLLLITGAEGENLRAVDVAAAFAEPLSDPLQALTTLGYAALETAAASADPITVALDDLGLPLNATYPHIAAGTNFRAHAEEVGLNDGPFLFPKLTEPSRWNASVPQRARTDYEAELCAVPLATYTVSQPASFGYVLCNDFTDRWTLVRDIDFDAPMGHTGFPDAKGGAGMLPIGPFLVVPKDDQALYPDIELKLYLNGDLRQRAPAGLMIWSPHDIAANALANCDATFHRTSSTTTLTDCDGIPAGTLLLTGTPEGVMFHVVSLWSASAYLEPGDEVITSGTYLGLLHNTIQ